MRVLIQRVREASVKVDGEVTGAIEQGLLVFLGVEAQDSSETVTRMLEKVLKYRVFSDENGRMNKSLRDIAGGLLVVSQFTLVADTKRGLRPSFSRGATPEHGEMLYQAFVEKAKEIHPVVATGRFGADMKVSLLNDGPVTFMLEM